MDNPLLYLDVDGLKYLAGLVVVALLLGLGAAVEQWWVERGRETWQQIKAEFEDYADELIRLFADHD